MPVACMQSIHNFVLVSQLNLFPVQILAVRCNNSVSVCMYIPVQYSVHNMCTTCMYVRYVQYLLPGTATKLVPVKVQIVQVGQYPPINSIQYTSSKQMSTCTTCYYRYVRVYTCMHVWMYMTCKLYYIINIHTYIHTFIHVHTYMWFVIYYVLLMLLHVCTIM